MSARLALSLTFVLIMALLMSACGGGFDVGTGPIIITPPTDTGVRPVTVTAAAATVVAGHGLPVTVQVRDGKGTLLDRPVLWHVRDDASISVSPSAMGTAIFSSNTPGPTIVWAESNGVMGAAAITVVAAVRTGIANIHTFTEPCPTTDSAYTTVRAHFDLRVDGQPVPLSLSCAGTFSTMPIEQLTDELLVLQALRTAYYMSRGTAGTLPWTSLGLYEWMRAQVSGVNIKTAPGQLYCCDQIGTRLYLSVSRQDAATRDIKRTWTGLAYTLDYFAHEIRHADANAPGHVRGCAAFPLPTDPTGCDATYDVQNLGSYGVQYWLSQAWATGSLDIGMGCAPETVAKAYAESNAASATSFRSRFVNGVPPAVIVYAPYGSCPPR